MANQKALPYFIKRLKLSNKEKELLKKGAHQKMLSKLS